MKLFRNPKKTVWLISAFLALFLLTLATKCRAADLEFGVGSTLVRGLTPVLDFSLSGPIEGLEANWQGSLTLVGSSTYGDVEQPNNFALQGLLVDGVGKLDVGLGVAFLQNTDRYNGSSLNFALQLAYRFGDFKVTIRHWSNAGTRAPNLGRDFVLLSYRF